MNKIITLFCLLSITKISFSQDLTFETIVTSTEACPSICSTTVEVVVTGGVAPYLYSLVRNTNIGSSHIIDATASTFTNICPGTYDITVKDANGNSVTTTNTTVSRPNILNLPTINMLSETSIEVIGEGGTPPYTYSIDGSAFAASNTFTDLTQGVYTVYVRDANDCVKSDIVYILELGLTVDSASQICNAFCEGGLYISVEGGEPPFQYSLYDDNNNTVFPPVSVDDRSYYFEFLCSGVYIIVVDSSNSLSSTIDAFVEEPMEPISASATLNLSSGIAASGVIETDVSGGLAPYVYSIDGGDFQTLNVFTGLATGSHDITVQDAYGCINQYIVDIGNIDIDSTVIINGFTLTATAEADTYQWINADTETIIPGATNKVYVATEPGNYRVEMTIDDLTTKTIRTKNSGKTISNKAIVTISSPVYQVSSSLSTNDSELNNLHIYPNPAHDYLVLPKKSINKAYNVYNVLGNKVDSGTVISDKLSTQNLLRGVYFLSVEGYNVSKFIKN